MGLFEDMLEALGRMAREEASIPLLQPELLPHSEVPLVARSDALSSLWLLDHLFMIAVFKLLCKFPFCWLGSPPPAKL